MRQYRERAPIARCSGAIPSVLHWILRPADATALRDRLDEVPLSFSLPTERVIHVPHERYVVEGSLLRTLPQITAIVPWRLQHASGEAAERLAPDREAHWICRPIRVELLTRAAEEPTTDLFTIAAQTLGNAASGLALRMENLCPPALDAVEERMDFVVVSKDLTGRPRFRKVTEWHG